MDYPGNDTDYEDATITEVCPEGDGWSIGFGSASFFCPGTSPIAPAAGMTARFYPGGIGRGTVRGLFLNGERVFYRTAAAQKAHEEQQQKLKDAASRAQWQEGLADYDRRVSALPKAFQERIAAFRAHNPDWGWRFGGYELFCCEQAALILVGETPGDGHSGNTLGTARSLATCFLKSPDVVVKMHGAMCPLVGCEDYGCYAARVKGATA